MHVTTRRRRDLGPVIDVGKARVDRDADLSIRFDDPSSPWLVRVWLGTSDGRRWIERIDIEARDQGAPVTSTRLARLPCAQLLHVAAALTAAAEPDRHPNETYWRMLAQPKPAGRRRWDDGHWDRVKAVYDWAETTNRPGGGAQAVGDLWGVAVDPTVYRWLAEARRRASGGGVTHA